MQGGDPGGGKMNIDLRLGDCLEVMKTIPAGSVDAVITDPPYGILTHSTSVWRGDMKPITRNMSWDNLTTGQYYRLILEFSRNILQLSSDNATLYLFCANEILFLVKKAIERAGWIYRIPNYWHKTNPAPIWNSHRPQSSIETICMATNGKANTFNVVNGGLCHNFFEYPLVSPAERVHQSQKPIKLITELILRSSNEGDTILDPFMGSGTTGVACVQTGRNFIGIEIDEGYFAIAKRRIEQAQMQPLLEGIIR